VRRSGGRFEGRVALVTGAARGQGAAVARLLAREGAAVVVGDILEEAAAAVVAEIVGSCGAGRACAARLDVGVEADWHRAMAALDRGHGGLDVLVNNAGIALGKGLERTSDAEWERVVAVNQRGPWLGMRAAVPLLKRRGGGAIVNVASIYAVVGSPASTAYHASKGALLAMTRGAAVELAQHGVRVNCVLPGAIDTAMLADIRPERLRELTARTPMERIGRAEEVASAVAFLASDEASFITGAALPVDGGYLAV
jgi:cyclopentanol dehydrogenase